MSMVNCCKCLSQHRVEDMETNQDMDSGIYCIPCIDELNMRRFARPNYEPDAPVVIEYDLVHDTKKRKVDDSVITLPLLNKKQVEYADKQKNPVECKQVEDKLTITQLAYAEWPDIVPCALQQKHPHAFDKNTNLNEQDDKHDYEVVFEGTNQKQVDFLQSTSSMVAQYFPKEVLTIDEFVSLPAGVACDDTFLMRAEELKKTMVKFCAEHPNVYQTLMFVDCVLKGRNWSPTSEKYALYYTEDHQDAIANLKLMMRDWKQKNRDACVRGKFVHFLIECDMNGQLDLATHPMYSQPHLKHIQQYLNWKRTRFDPLYVPWRTEMRFMSSSRYRRVGTCDLLAVRKDHGLPSETNSTLSLVMIDWKNKQIEKRAFFDSKTRRFKTGIFPMSRVQDCSLFHYELQQADYEKLLVENYHNLTFNGHVYAHAKITERKLVCFDDANPGNEAMEEMLEHNYANELEWIWNRRAEDVEAWVQAGMPADIKNKKEPPIDDSDLDLILSHMLHKNRILRNARDKNKK